MLRFLKLFLILLTTSTSLAQLNFCEPCENGFKPSDEPPGCFLVNSIYNGNTGGYTSDTVDYEYPCGTIDNSQWISLISDGSGDFIIYFSFSNCENAEGAELAVYDKNLNFISVCEVPTDTIDTKIGQAIFNIVPNDTFYLMIDGVNGDICDFEIEAFSGISTTFRYFPPPDLTRSVDFEIVCVGATVCYSFPPIQGATGYEWQLPSIGELLSGGTSQDTFCCLQYLQRSSGEEIRVKGVGNCSDGQYASFNLNVESASEIVDVIESSSVCPEDFPLMVYQFQLDSFGLYFFPPLLDLQTKCFHQYNIFVFPENAPKLLDTLVCPGECIVLGDSCYFESTQNPFLMPCQEISELRLNIADTSAFQINCLSDTFINALGFNWQVFGADSFSVFINNEFHGNRANSSFLLPINSNLGDSVNIRVLPFNHLGCPFQMSELTCSVPNLTSILEREQHGDIKIYPNPSNDLFQILSNELIEKTEVFTLAGKSVLESFESTIDLENFPSGIYFFKVKMKNQTVIRKVVKF